MPPFVPFALPAILLPLVVRCLVSLSSKMTSQTASRIFWSERAICRQPSSTQREPSTRRVHVLILARQRYSSAGLPRPMAAHYTASGSTPILMEAEPEASRPKSSNDCSLPQIHLNPGQSCGTPPKGHISSASPVSGLWFWLIKDVRSCYRSRGDFSKRRLRSGCNGAASAGASIPLVQLSLSRTVHTSRLANASHPPRVA